MHFLAKQFHFSYTLRSFSNAVAWKCFYLGTILPWSACASEHICFKTLLLRSSFTTNEVRKIVQKNTKKIPIKNGSSRGAWKVNRYQTNEANWLVCFNFTSINFADGQLLVANKLTRFILQLKLQFSLKGMTFIRFSFKTSLLFIFHFKLCVSLFCIGSTKQRNFALKSRIH